MLKMLDFFVFLAAVPKVSHIIYLGCFKLWYSASRTDLLQSAHLIPLVAKLLLSKNLKYFPANLPLGSSAGAMLPLAAHQFNEVKKLTTTTFAVSEALSLLNYRGVNQRNPYFT